MRAAEGPVEMGGAWGAKSRATKLVLEPQMCKRYTKRMARVMGECKLQKDQWRWGVRGEPN
jgi:hypothetical protein